MPAADLHAGQRWRHRTFGDVYVIVRKTGCWALLNEQTGHVWGMLPGYPDITDIFGNAQNNNLTRERNLEVMISSWELV